MNEVEIKAISDKLAEIKSDVQKAAELAVKNHGDLTNSTKAQIDQLLATQAELKGRLSAAEQEIVSRSAAAASQPVAVKSFGEQVVESEEFKSAFVGKRVIAGMNATVNVKTANVTTDLSPTRIVLPERLPSLPRLRRALFLREIIGAGTTQSNLLEYVRVTGFTNAAEPVTEGHLKPRSTLSYDLKTSAVTTLAHLYKASKQILADFGQLASDINNEMTYGLKLVEETQMLNGSGTGANLLGIIPQASAYSGAFTPANDQNIDTLRLAILQAELALLPADAIVMHPTDWAKIELTKDSQGRYIFANPVGGVAPPSLWGLNVVSTQAMTAGHFLTGGFASAATVYDREDMNVQIATQNNDDFEKNMITIRCEERLALVVKRPEAFIYGAFV